MALVHRDEERTLKKRHIPVIFDLSLFFGAWGGRKGPHGQRLLVFRALGFFWGFVHYYGRLSSWSFCLCVILFRTLFPLFLFWLARLRDFPASLSPPSLFLF